MPRYVAFLRAINVGGRNVEMVRLAALFEALGGSSVETLLASGNVIFHSPARGRRALALQIESRLEQELGFAVATFLRTAAEVARIAGHSPFPAAEVARAGAFVVGLLAAPLTPAQAATLQSMRSPIDDLRADGSEIYWLCRRKQSDSTFSNAVFERTLGVRATFRSRSTLVRLAAKCASAERQSVRTAADAG